MVWRNDNKFRHKKERSDDSRLFERTVTNKV